MLRESTYKERTISTRDHLKVWLEVVTLSFPCIQNDFSQAWKTGQQQNMSLCRPWRGKFSKRMTGIRTRKWPKTCPKTSRVQIGTRDTIFWGDPEEMSFTMPDRGQGYGPMGYQKSVLMCINDSSSWRVAQRAGKKIRVGERSVPASTVIWISAAAVLIISCNMALATSKKMNFSTRALLMLFSDQAQTRKIIIS